MAAPPSAAMLLAAVSAVLSLWVAGCGGYAGDTPGGDEGGALGAGGSTCSKTRCDGERDQCIGWLNFDREDCADNCSGTLDNWGCIQSCYDLHDTSIASRCDSQFEACTASEKVNECWDGSNPEGKCVGTSEISCAQVGDLSACETVPGCEASGSYSELTETTYWSCEGQPAACSDMKDAGSCRALRCTWQ